MLPNDPYMLLSFVNMKLRDSFSDLDDMCDYFDVSKVEIIDKMSSIGYTYIFESNSFKVNDK